MSQPDQKRDRRFRKHEHLRRGADFEAVYARKCIFRSGVLTVFAKSNELTWTRLGLSVSRRFGNAVRRARMKRVLREQFRLCKADLPTGLDLVLIPAPRRDISSAEYGRTLVQAAKVLARKLGSKSTDSASAAQRSTPTDRSRPDTHLDPATASRETGPGLQPASPSQIEPAADVDHPAVPRQNSTDAEMSPSEMSLPDSASMRKSGPAIGVIVGLVWIYRATLGPILGGQCRFHPSCSEYMLLAVRKHGAWAGFWMGLGRIGRCHPFHRGGLDLP